MPSSAEGLLNLVENNQHRLPGSSLKQCFHKARTSCSVVNLACQLGEEMIVVCWIRYDSERCHVYALSRTQLVRRRALECCVSLGLAQSTLNGVLSDACGRR